MPARRRYRIDPRLIVGVLLMVISVVGVVWVISASAQTTRIYAANRPLAPGTVVTQADLTLIEVSAAAPTKLYLTDLTETSYVTTRTIGAGELIPRSALGEADGTTSVLVVSIPGALPSSALPGAEVSVWSAAPGERPGTYQVPEVIVPSAHIVRLIPKDDFVAQASVDVELRVPKTQLATLMHATADGARLQLVPLHELPLTASEGAS